MLAPSDIVRAVHRCWSQELLLTAPTLYPGIRLALDDAPTWYEVWVDAWSDSPRRATAPDQLAVSILIHCFSRDPVQKRGVHDLAAAARTALGGRCLPILDAEDALCGRLSIREQTAHDLTRNHAALGQESLQHLVLAFSASAQETPA